jgi:uncharacterized protein YndB with AHSA1/START domain
MKDHEPKDVDFFDRAPLRVTASATFAHSPERVFGAFADASGWPEWFPLMVEARWTSKDIECVGAEREVRLRLLGRFHERFIAWDPGERFAFTMLASTSPLATAIAEDYRLTSLGSGHTRLDWVLAAEPTRLGRLLRPGLEMTMKRVVAQAGKNLDRRLRAGAA